MTNEIFTMDGETMTINFYITRFLMRVEELEQTISQMKKVYRTKRTNQMKMKIEFVEHTLKVNQQFLQLITHKNVLPELIQ
jgi:hypothetical protein